MNARAADTHAVPVLGDAQRQAVEWGEGPLMVLAGAGTGKTTVVVERVCHLLARDPDLAPENILVLTYNVKAAAELTERMERRLGVERAGRIPIHNFHSFGYRLLREHRAEAGLAADAPTLDQIGQRLLMRELRPRFRELLYHRTGGDTSFNTVLDGISDVIGRAKDELVTPADFERFAHSRQADFTARHGEGAWADAVESVRQRALEGETRRVEPVRREWLANGPEAARKTADREARRKASGIERALAWNQLDERRQGLAEGLRATFLRDAEAMEVMRLRDEATAYAIYQEELARRGALDFGEQILRAITLLTERPNVALALQRRFRHVLVDEFQDANMAQILLLELVGRGPDKADNVVVVGDDDQSIYRFRGASYAAFERFSERFGMPPAWDPTRATAPVTRLRLLENRRSSGNVLAAAGRLIAHNSARLKAGEALTPTRDQGVPVEAIIAPDEEEEADVAVTRIREAFEALPEPRRWDDICVLTRRHRHRDAIVERLARAGIPHVVVGASGLFGQPEIRDLEAALRVLADPTDSASFARLLTAGPWRCDAVELLAVRRLADFDDRPLAQAARDMLAREDASDALRVKLQRLHGCLDELRPRATRDGPATLLEEYLVRTNLVHDLVAVGHPDAQRQVLNISRFMRFVHEHESGRPRDSLVDFVAWLDLFLEVGGELETESGISHDGRGVNLMTIHQAKGLEWQVVIVPRIVEGQFPDTRSERQLLPLELLKQTPPEQFEVDEERRLLYVAMTRARSRLILTSVEGGASGRLRPSRFIGEVAPTEPDATGTAEDGTPAGSEGPPLDVSLLRLDADGDRGAPGSDPLPDPEAAADGGSVTAALERILPVPTALERRYALRRRAVELIGLMEHLEASDDSGRAALSAELTMVAAEAAGAVAEDRRRGLDPLTLRVLAGHSPAGRSLLDSASLPPAFSHSQFQSYSECGLRYAFERVYHIPIVERKGFFEFGSAAHRAFETWVRQRREAHAAGQPPPGLDALEAAFGEVWRPERFADAHEAQQYRERSAPLLRRFHDRELASAGRAVALEQGFRFELDPGDGSDSVRVGGQIDRIDRLPDGSIEVIDYKTGHARSQADVDVDQQLSTYALALSRGAVSDEVTGEVLPAPARLTLYFTEADIALSTTRTAEQLDQHAARLVALAQRIRAGDFAARPDFRRCGWCAYRRLCPSRYGAPEG